MMDFEQTLAQVVEAVRQGYDPERIVVFGSHARGEASPGSDLDLLVVKRTDAGQVDRIVAVSRLLREYRRAPYRLAFDILVQTPEELQSLLEMGDSFTRQIVREGRVVYERAA
jgi:predicted nucleotidyltransferase